LNSIKKMTNAEINALIELASIKAARAAISEARIEWVRDITHHQATCAVGKYRTIAHVISACLGGIIATLLGWFIKRL
jgi:hypothetical protein